MRHIYIHTEMSHVNGRLNQLSYVSISNQRGVHKQVVEEDMNTSIIMNNNFKIVPISICGFVGSC